MQKQKGMLTSHELGFYKDFASYLSGEFAEEYKKGK